MIDLGYDHEPVIALLLESLGEHSKESDFTEAGRQWLALLCRVRENRGPLTNHKKQISVLLEKVENTTLSGDEKKMVMRAISGLIR